MKLDALFDCKMWLSEARAHTLNGSKEQRVEVCIFHCDVLTQMGAIFYMCLESLMDEITCNFIIFSNSSNTSILLNLMCTVKAIMMAECTVYLSFYHFQCLKKVDMHWTYSYIF